MACGVIINCISDNGRGLLALKVEGTGKTDTLDVITTLRNNAAVLPAPGNALSFGELDVEGEFTTVTSSMKITNAEETDEGFTLTLVDYNPALYEYGTLPEYKTNITSIPDGSNKTIAEQRDYLTEGDAQAIATEAAQGVTGDMVQAAVDTIQNGYRFTNIYNVRPVEETLEEIVARLDDDARNTSASISISEDEILLQVQDMERELVGLIDIQAGSVTALVEGGGATGQMSLSLNLPVMIDATKRQQLINASTAVKVNAVYGLVEGTGYYGIKGNASSAAVKALWDDAVAANLIASQIDLTATQIHINGDNVYINGSTMFEGEVGAKKIKAALIEVDNLLAGNVAVKDKGVIHSTNYNGTIDANGNITAYGSAGWAIDHAGKSDFVNLNDSGVITATDLNIICRAGNVLFRRLFEGFYCFNRITTQTIYSQIIASGVISVNVQATPLTTGNAGNGGVTILKVEGTTETQIKTIWFTDSSTSVREDVPIAAGNSIKILILGQSGGPSVTSNEYNISVFLSSDRSQSILAYLGDIKTNVQPSPAR